MGLNGQRGGLAMVEYISLVWSQKQRTPDWAAQATAIYSLAILEA